METIQIRIPAPTLDNKLRQERAALALKLQTKIANEERIADYLGRKPKVDNHPLLDRFVKGIDIAYKTQLNIRAMQNILATVQRNQPIAQMDRVKRVQQLSIMYRNGIIRPKNTVSQRQSRDYRWELKSRGQPWVSISAKNTSNPCADLVRLCYKDIVSNIINIKTVIKRQSFTAKRKQYRFNKHDIEFHHRCFGVAWRILRLTTPTSHPRSMSNGFSMRIFQDRVSRLPSYMDMGVPNIIDLCRHKLTTTRYISPIDTKYIKMVEFCEPTIHLNPAALRRKLKKINSGHEIKLKLFDDLNSDDSGSSDSESSESSGSDTEGETTENDSVTELSIDDRVVVVDGKYVGETGRIVKVTNKMYQLELDSGATTASGRLPMVKHEQVAAASQPGNVSTEDSEEDSAGRFGGRVGGRFSGKRQRTLTIWSPNCPPVPV